MFLFNYLGHPLSLIHIFSFCFEYLCYYIDANWLLLWGVQRSKYCFFGDSVCWLPAVDDEYIIVGSANINERSMDGARDSEIAMGAYQPYHLATHSPAAGQIHGFRMALWFEHTGFLDNLFLQPWSLECMRRVNHRGDELWRLFAQEEVVDLPGHLMTYPYHIGLDGSLSVLGGSELIPDSNGKVLGGAPNSLLAYAIPDLLTT